jgi:segregation and condensation protein A
MTYTIKLKQFEGPFDLLLYFIERDELDIYDIPIANITEDFLAYIRDMEAMNIDLASEFILVAASLMRIKAKMLLPRKDLDEEGNEIDPREELVNRLLEYKRYKEVLEDLRKLEKERGHRAERGNVSEELQEMANRALADAELESLTLYRLMKAFDRLMEDWKRERVRQVHTVYRYQYTVQEQSDRIRNLLTKKESANFEEAFAVCTVRMHAIVTFLALLEMANQHKIRITQGEGVNNFWLSLEEEAEVAT